MFKKNIFIYLLIFFASTSQLLAQNNKFKVVLDAGHGGKDFGANYYGFLEKNIALNVALKVGEILEKNKDIQVIYTRKTDVFIELDERARIANKANANLFVSIHCNAAKSPAYGTETFVMGTTKNASNLEVAKKENSVITLEKDYQVKYEGYDPKSPETLIGITLLQEEYRDQSITLASKIQDQYTNKLERKNRGVKEAPFLVLHRTSMPSVLTEIGFISYKEEGKYLDSDEGQDDIAKALANAILSYKKEYFGGGVSFEDIKPSKQVKPIEKEEVERTETPKPVLSSSENNAEPSNKGLVFKIQISASGKKLETVASNFKGLSPISREQEGNLFKYFYGDTADYAQAKKYLEEAKNKGYDSAFIIATKEGKRISIKEALNQ